MGAPKLASSRDTSGGTEGCWWPAQLGLGRWGIKGLVQLRAAFWLRDAGEQVLPCTSGSAQLCLIARQRLKS